MGIVELSLLLASPLFAVVGSESSVGGGLQTPLLMKFVHWREANPISAVASRHALYHFLSLPTGN